VRPLTSVGVFVTGDHTLRTGEEAGHSLLELICSGGTVTALFVPGTGCRSVVCECGKYAVSHDGLYLRFGPLGSGGAS
jgi:hypothetical protein